MKRRNIIIIAAVVLVVAIGAVLITQANARQNQNSLYQTAVISKGDLTAFVGATGRVRPNQSTQISWQTSGRVESIQVEIGDLVESGQILANLSDASLSQSIILSEADLVTARRSLEDLKTSEVARANAQLALVKAQDALDDAQKSRNRKDYTRSSQENLDIARSNYIISEDGVRKAQELYDKFSGLSEENAMRAEAFSQLAVAKQNRDRALANLNWLLGRPDSQEVALADANLEVARANLASAEREWERLKNGPDPEDISAAEARVKALESTISQARLEAPFAGTITESVSLVGDQVNPGTKSFRLDDLSHLLVDVEVPEVDINRIREGFPAQITFDAILGKEYLGIVKKVGKVGTTGSGVVNFIVTVEIQNADSDVRPGMTAAVNVIVTQLEGVLLIPNRAVRLVDGQRTVFLLKNGQQTSTPIELGASSDQFSEILSGDVKEGDQIILNPVIPGSNFMMGPQRN